MSAVDLMLLGTVLLWALNATVTRYVLTHGFQPLAYATIRYACATILFWGFTYARERSFRIALRDMRLVLLAALFIFCNQLCFVYAVDKTSAATVTLFLGSTPIFIGDPRERDRARANGARLLDRDDRLADRRRLRGLRLRRVLRAADRRRARGPDRA